MIPQDHGTVMLVLQNDEQGKEQHFPILFSTVEIRDDFMALEAHTSWHQRDPASGYAQWYGRANILPFAIAAF